jgi:predicted metalloprotease with PDZ domain
VKLGTTLVLLLLACSPEQVGCEARTDDEAEGAVDNEGAQALPAVEPRGDGSAVEHTVRFPSPAQHTIEVETVFSAEGESVDVMMAVWTPGSYLVREFARHVHDVSAHDVEGTELSVEKTSKNRWTVSAPGGLPSRVVVRYDIYAREASVRTNFVDTDLALLNGASAFLVPAEQLDAQQDVKFEMPESWATSVTSLEAYPGEAHRYLARDYEELVDSPIALGNPSLHTFEVGGAEHVLATFGGEDIWDDERAGRDVQALVETQAEFWGVVPYRRYVFINLLLESGGGLEHRASTVMLASRWDARDDDSYRRWLGLVSHEFFHTWNIKRLRPASLGPFDFERENYTHDLWIVEGITSYYDDLLQRRAGLLTNDEYFARIGKGITRLQATPGRHTQSLAASSFDSWIHFYRPDENSRNSGVSYYTKGSLVAWLLDARIRRATGGSKSLDDAMRLAYSRFSGEEGYSTEAIRDTFAEVAGESLDEFFADYVDGTEELDYASALREFGLREGGSEEEASAWFGVSTSESHGRLVVSQVVSGSPAHTAGINVDDELLAFDEERVPVEWAARLERYSVDDELAVLVSRRGRLRRVTVTLLEAPQGNYEISEDPEASPSSRSERGAWLGD